MLLTTGVLAGLVAVDAASPAPTGSDNRGRWSISCDGDNKCGYVQSGGDHGTNHFATRTDRSVEASSGQCHTCVYGSVNESICGVCKGRSLKRKVGTVNLECYSPSAAEGMCVVIRSAPASADIHNATGVAVSLLRRGIGSPQYGSEAPDSTAPGYASSKPTYPAGNPHGSRLHDEEKPNNSTVSSTAAYVKPSQGSGKPSHGPPGHGPEKPTPVVVTTFVTYDKPTPAHGKPFGGPESPTHGPPEVEQPSHASGKSSHGPPATTSAYGPPTPVSGKFSDGPVKPLKGPVASLSAYGPPTPNSGKPSHGPGKPTPPSGKPTGGPKKPSEKEHSGKPEKPIPSPQKAAGGKPHPGIPAHGKPAGKDVVSTKPVTYIEFDESECIDCHKGDSCSDECDWMFACGQKKKCFHNGARDIVEICYEKGQNCDDEEHSGYEKPWGESKSPGKPAPEEEKYCGHE